MFKNVEIFDGDFTFQKQKPLVSKLLVQLIIDIDNSYIMTTFYQMKLENLFKPK